MSEPKYYIIYKPYGMLPQFTDEGDRSTLATLYPFPKDVYPIGRLDMDSEGLLIISNDKKLNHRLLNPDFAHKRKYLVQLDGAITTDAAKMLESGVEIMLNNKKYLTKKAQCKIINTPEYLPERNPPVRFRANIPTSWIELTLTEGKNRQVRRMTAKVGFPTLRLIRISIENLMLKEYKPGMIFHLSKKEIYAQLNIKE